MIYLSASICWPFKYDSSYYGDYFYKDWKLTKHKRLEIQAAKGSDEIIGFVFRLAWRSDHAGLSLDLSLFRRSLYIQVYDTRHWDYEKGRYTEYDQNALSQLHDEVDDLLK